MDRNGMASGTRVRQGGPTYPFGCANIRVGEVDAETGEVRILRHGASTMRGA